MAGDTNKTPIEDILDCLGTLKNIQVEATRKDEILDLVITDLHTFYLPTATIAPLTVDPECKGKDSDHNIIIFPPIQLSGTKVDRTY